MKKDITTSDDVKKMVDSFYQKVNEDEVLSPIFNDFAGVDWEEHLPIMYQFWGSILLGEATYSGHPFAKHIPLPIDQTHFERWVSLFTHNVEVQFEGTNADEAKLRAKTIGQIFQAKKEYLNQITHNK